MSETINQCPKCSGKMVQGFVFDRSLTSDRVLRWVQGEPEIGGATGIKLVGKETSKISRTDKCGNCGYLEFFASKDIEYI
jgi:hypothetical protein